VGYIIGCPSIPDFISRYDSYLASVLEPSTEIARPELDPANPAPWFIPGTIQVNPECLAELAYVPERLIMGDLAADGKSRHRDDMAAKYKATMHIDLLEPWQRKGWGKQLIEKLVAAVKEQGGYGEGVHLVAGADNTNAVKFYEKVGFTSLEGGEKEGGTFWMARKI
jgi:GNAT superfamily N-acetyltransferase